MRAVRGKDTKPERIVRRAAHALGFRFRLHRMDLPGRPDLVFPKLKIALFVHGCFWHRHKNCKKASIPVSNVEFWTAKLARNVKRDRVVQKELRSLGWSVGVFWECQIRNSDHLRTMLRKILHR